jgi:anti-sigma factor RsiW
MDCREVRALADAYLSGRLPVETRTALDNHLETCPACRAEIDARRAERIRLQAAFAGAGSLAPTEEFLNRLTTRLQEQETRSPSRRDWLRSWWTLAAGVVLAAGGGLVTRRVVHRSRLAALARDAAGDHQNCAIRFNLSERPVSLETAAAQYDPTYASLLTLQAPSDLPAGSMAVLDRHSCVYNGRRFGHVVFRYQGHPVSLLVTASTDSDATSPVIVAADARWSVASFGAGRHAFFIVSDLTDRDTLDVARALAGPLSQRFAGA